MYFLNKLFEKKILDLHKKWLGDMAPFFQKFQNDKLFFFFFFFRMKKKKIETILPDKFIVENSSQIEWANFCFYPACSNIRHCGSLFPKAYYM